MKTRLVPAALLTLGCIGLIVIIMLALVDSAMAGTPLTCDNKPADHHAHRAKQVASIAHDGSRFLDATPATQGEKRKWRDHKLCILDKDRRHHLAEFVDKKKAQFDAHFIDLLTPPPQSTMEAIASCESGGDPNAYNPAGPYYGKYQFDLDTWSTVSGDGDPRDASEREQDYRAALLYQRRGAQPWPVCGR